MSKRREEKAFADVVAEVKNAAPDPQTKRTSPGIYGDTLLDLEGRWFRRVEAEVSSSRAQELAANGAAVAWDPCGCGGYCGLTWYDSDAVARMVASGPPRIANKKRRKGNISEWHADDGADLLLAEDAVSWSDLLG